MPFTALALIVTTLHAADINYPATRKVDHVDNYQGVKVADPYRWLEDDRSADAADWVTRQNEATFHYLSAIPYRPALKRRLEQLNNYEKQSAPMRRGDYLYYTHNSGLQNQAIWYRRKGDTGTPELVLDPNKLSATGTTRLAGFALSKDGKYAAYGVSVGGSDWSEIRVRDLTTLADRPDRVEWVKASAISWRRSGFYYSRYPAPEKGKELTSKNEFHTVYYHRLGTPQSDDELAYEDKLHGQRFHRVLVSEDEKIAVLSISERGRAALGNALWVKDEAKGDKAFRPLIPEIGDTKYNFSGYVGGKVLVFTDNGAPNGRVVAIDPAKPAPENWVTIIPESKDSLTWASFAAGRLFAHYLHDAASRIAVYQPQGKLERELTLPGPGNVTGLEGGEQDAVVHYTFNSMLEPGSIYRFNPATNQTTRYWSPKVEFAASQFETRRVFFSSKDGTRVPMFLAHKKGLKLDGSNPVVVYGYGGFTLSNLPNFSADRISLLEQGVVYASVCLRGGLEYGEAWHRAGMREKKQNVFDDFIAAAEYLIKEKYTSPGKLAARGASNGGLLVGAVINQRPDLFAAAAPHAGVMDMLRFQKFTIGWNWVAEYGSSDNAADFAYLKAYSPIHNAKDGARYPAIFITTADHDDRVVPAHSFKYAAVMQEMAARVKPVLIRIDTNSGHGASSTAKRLEQETDVQAFLFQILVVQPKF
ncbi:MAG: prolyl oligopeptidase family serine peptidase [Acidobacteria bacterium]|nr:prolyl oligopeptidase family serine peptidase [Acidobacteriota bacterium]